MFWGWSKKKMLGKLEAASREGYRLVSSVRVLRQPPLAVLLEKTAVPAQRFEYRWPQHAWDPTVMNDLGAEAFRAHPLDPWIKERDPLATVAYEYQSSEAASTGELADDLEEMVTEGWSFVCFCPGPDTVLPERSKPGRERASPQQCTVVRRL